jgi:hypothetical protein
MPMIKAYILIAALALFQGAGTQIAESSGVRVYYPPEVTSESSIMIEAIFWDKVRELTLFNETTEHAVVVHSFRPDRAGRVRVALSQIRLARGEQNVLGLTLRVSEKESVLVRGIRVWAP